MSSVDFGKQTRLAPPPSCVTGPGEVASGAELVSWQDAAGQCEVLPQQTTQLSWRVLMVAGEEWLTPLVLWHVVTPSLPTASTNGLNVG